ncbi:molecular chaperone TorD family protein [Eggerthellaceae bacterium zg-1084]|uniref:Molecular chaperone TorD family protein n=1 Tax=Berryella wangjianweii TaxID=2734634 RepID=A0A6M8J615_9ACTN|nr:molecular chaperone TorD family protein [Berryella wangjianweii]NPD31373.1 molecular chaperone TorD family protein [Berryella wangjianweii]NPD32320.1 molecular chaperone TorD family protein [Eggerthellaceae bacterium zg-997]QKF06909.1 molecular chaperone TorD family protein [Berryella wangjianweii]
MSHADDLMRAAELFSPVGAGAGSKREWSVAQSMARRAVLTPGLPAAALPVESFYKSFGARRSGFAATAGHYRSDAARHLELLYTSAGIGPLPREFAAMPDHLSLICEFVSLLLEAGNTEAARQVAYDHLDWMEAYDERLNSVRADIQAEVAQTGAAEGTLSHELLIEGIDELLDAARGVRRVREELMAS